MIVVPSVGAIEHGAVGGRGGILGGAHPAPLSDCIRGRAWYQRKSLVQEKEEEQGRQATRATAVGGEEEVVARPACATHTTGTDVWGQRDRERAYTVMRGLSPPALPSSQTAAAPESVGASYFTPPPPGAAKPHTEEPQITTS
ncbi:hypothetical protein NHX12_029363 [Muraenolepis orangiensis]|uniref:Uncharacterized protein n=1 Tax=Muraenolepis orangiensis TaxID=630683 RepID=A0A9Q0EFH1_9TELE|nr:hypothetical protein NHX12_029363 [Muraenolepis orangiensis]